ncbi:hypothetical protein BKA82DRAFT_2767782 [Pisolithus tinctorius]|nr:hypothetical protein BKA82DRAFT_2767782 [Pisolithus tinctorius]
MWPAETIYTPPFTPTPGPSEPTPTTQAQNLCNPSTPQRTERSLPLSRDACFLPFLEMVPNTSMLPVSTAILIRSHRHLDYPNRHRPHRCRTCYLIPAYFPPHHSMLVRRHQHLDHPNRYRPRRHRTPSPCPPRPLYPELEEERVGGKHPSHPMGKQSNTDPRTGSLKTGRLSVPLLLVR